MVMPYDSVGTLLTNIGMFGGGIAFGVLGLILGAVRGITKNSELWAITFSAIAWLIAMMIPTVTWALTIFIAGAVGISLSFMPILKKMEDTNIFAIAIISMVINILLLFGSGAYKMSLGWEDNINGIQDDIGSLLGAQATSAQAITPTHGLCRPDDPTCTTETTASSFLDSVFDPILSALAVVTYIGKAMNLAGSAVLAPFVIAKTILSKIGNTIIYYLIAIMVTFWNFAIIYKTIAFILSKRGMSG